MIIRRDDASLLFIRQSDHAGLAADLVAQLATWGPSEPRRAAILLATREHDNGWLEEDDVTHVNDAGEPLDFMSVPPAVKHRIWPRAAARLAESDPYAGALVAQHALSVHAQLRTDPLWRMFLDRMERIRADLLARAGGDAARTLEGDYRFVQAGDQLSLIFCNGWTAPFPRPGGRTILNGTTLEITPDPFAGARASFRVAARRIPGRTFASAADLRAAVAGAPVEYLAGEAVGG